MVSKTFGFFSTSYCLVLTKLKSITTKPLFLRIYIFVFCPLLSLQIIIKAISASAVETKWLSSLFTLFSSLINHSQHFNFVYPMRNNLFKRFQFQDKMEKQFSFLWMSLLIWKFDYFLWGKRKIDLAIKISFFCLTFVLKYFVLIFLQLNLEFSILVNIA